MLITRISIFISLLLTSALTELSGYPAGSNTGHEEIFVHTDRDIYMAGEELFFRLYMIPGKGSGNDISKIAHVVLRNANNANIVTFAAELENNGTWGHIYLPDTLSTGLYHLTSFTNWMKNFGEETFSNKQLLIVNRFDKELAMPVQRFDTAENSDFTGNKEKVYENQIKITTCNEEYGIRNPVTIGIDPGNIDSLIYMSVTVVPELSLIFPYGEQNKNGKTGMSPAEGSIHLKEISGYIISGKVADSESGEGVAGARVLVTTPDNRLNLMYAETESDGSFHLQLNRFYDGRELYISMDKNVHQGPCTIIIDNKAKLDATPVIPVDIGNKTRDYIYFSQDIVRVRKVYDVNLIEQEINAGIAEDHPPLVYSNPLFTIYPENFEPLNDFQEISRELISVLRIRRQNNLYHARMLDGRSEYSFFNEEPAIFLDGLKIRDINSIMHLGSDDIERIEILNYQWAYGDMQFPGILAVFTGNDLYREIILPEPITIFKHQDFLPKSGYPVVNHFKDSGLYTEVPDFRQLLFWDPAIKIEHGQEYRSMFHTSDLTGKYLIVVEGITNDGKRLSGIKGIIVR